MLHNSLVPKKLDIRCEWAIVRRSCGQGVLEQPSAVKSDAEVALASSS